MTGDDVADYRISEGLSCAELAERLSRPGRELRDFDVARWEDGLRRVPGWASLIMRPPKLAGAGVGAPNGDAGSVVLKLEAIGDDLASAWREWQKIESVAAQQIVERELWRRRIGPVKPPRPWVAELTGTDPRYGFARRFLKGKKDYSESNSVGSRGVYIYYILRPGTVYEVNKLISWSRQVRYFGRVADGVLVKMDESEVLECLT